MSRSPKYSSFPVMRILTLVAVVLLAVLLVFWALFLFSDEPADTLESPSPTPVETPSPTPEPTPTPTPEPTEAPSATPTPEPDYEPGSYTETDIPTWHQYNYALGESEAVDLDYFSDAAFVGDSLTDGLLIYSQLNTTTAANLSHQGLNVLTAVTEDVITVGGEKVSAVDALKAKDYAKVYILLGVNELGWYNDQRFYNTYADLVDAVKANAPNAVIYLQTLLPVTAEKSRTHDYFNNEKILVYNDLIAKLAQEKGVYLLDTHVSVMNDDGVLPADGSSDGIHLTRSYYAKWLDYLRTHTAPGS